VRFLVRGSAFEWATRFLYIAGYNMETKKKACCVFRRRRIKGKEALKERLAEVIENKEE